MTDKNNPYALKPIVKRAREKAENRGIRNALKKALWNKTKAKDLLEISYMTLYTKMKALKISRKPGRKYERKE